MKKIPRFLLRIVLCLGIISPVTAYSDDSIQNTSQTISSTTNPLSDTNSFMSSSDLIAESSTTTSTESSDEQMSTSKTTSAKSTEQSTTTSSYFSSEETISTQEEMERSPSTFAILAIGWMVDGLQGNGTQETPFQLGTLEDWQRLSWFTRQLAQNANTKEKMDALGTVYAKLVNDIYVDTNNSTHLSITDNPIGSKSNISKNLYCNVVIDGAKSSSDPGYTADFDPMTINEDSPSNPNYFTVAFINLPANQEDTINKMEDGMFATGSSYMTITLRNLNIGSKANPISNYFGGVLCVPLSSHNSVDIIANLENVHYYAESGGQPFWENNNTNSIYNFSGISSYIVPRPGNKNEEFAEIEGSINFSENSYTKIVHKTDNPIANRGLFWTYRNNVEFNIKESAIVDIESAKTYFIYMDYQYSLNFNIAANGQLNYTFNPNYKDKDGTIKQVTFASEANELTGNRNTFLGKNASEQFPITFTLAESSQMNFDSTSEPIKIQASIQHTEDIAQVSFNNQTAAHSAVSNIHSSYLEFQNKTQNFYKYETTPLNQTEPSRPVGLLESQKTIKWTSQLATYRKILYDAAVTFQGINAIGESGKDESGVYSKITSNLVGVQSPLSQELYHYKVQYYITDQTTTLSNAQITTKFEQMNNQSHQEGKVETNNFFSIGTDISTTQDLASTAELDELLTGEYVVYARVVVFNKSDSSVKAYTNWKHTDFKQPVIVPLYKSIVTPTKIDITNAMTYTLNKSTNKMQASFKENVGYLMRNESNQFVTITPIGKAKNEGVSNITIIPTGNTISNNELKMIMAVRNGQSNWDIGSLASINLENPILPTNKGDFSLPPYWDTNNANEFYFTGDNVYGGDIFHKPFAVLDYEVQFFFTWLQSE